MKITVSRIKIEEEEIDLPTECPDCGADWTREGGMVRYDAREEYCRATLDEAEGRVTVDDADETDSGECFATCIDLGCAGCGWMLSRWERT